MTCRFCNQKFSLSQAFSRHRKKGCKAKSAYKLELESNIKKLEENTHEEIFKVDNKVSYACDYCDRSFLQSNNLSRHEKTCKSKMDPICNMERQLGIILEVNDELTCRFCKFSYTTQSAYSKHKNKFCLARIKYEDVLKEKIENLFESL